MIIDRMRYLRDLLTGRIADDARRSLLAELERIAHRHDCRELKDETLRLKICSGLAPDRRRSRAAGGD